MLKFIRQRLFRASSLDGRNALQAWAESSGWTMRNSRDRDGFIIETRAGVLEGRVEWGPSQRHYMGSHELRLRGEVPALSGEAHALVMPRLLLDSVEAELFSQFVGGVQTRIDEETPEEMRWLAVSPKLSGALLGELKAHYAAVSNRVPWLAHWLHGPLGEALLQRALGPAEAAPPFALIVHRNRLTLRVALPDPDVATVQAAQNLFELALEQARVTADEPAADEDEGPPSQ
ncbi:hypothetical protein [Ideonella sp.]|uniref:hypothetical protein n=1 Tax=Ideonella sp. TaxID=1929293 RepID=UPI0035B18A96